MDYSRYSDRLEATYSLTTGTARAGYPASAVGSFDPSEICWANETEIALLANLGAALEVQAVFLFNHNFDAGTNVRLQATGIDVPITIEPAYLNGFACDAWVNLAQVVPSAVTRTKQNWTITNVGDANSRSVYIGEVWFAAVWRRLGPYTIGHTYKRGTEDISALSTSKRGVQTVYDMGTRARDLTGSVRTDDVDTLLDWYDAQQGRVRPMVVVLDQDGATARDREPHLCRFASSRRELASIQHDALGDIAVAFQELGRGEVVSGA